MSIPAKPPQPPITLLPTELWFLIIANLDLPSLEKAMCAFYSLFRTLSIEPTIQPTLLPSLLRWLNDANGTEELVAKLPFEVLDSIFQYLEPQDKVIMAVGLWRDGWRPCKGGKEKVGRRRLEEGTPSSSDSSGG